MAESEDVGAKSKRLIREIKNRAFDLRDCVEKMRPEHTHLENEKRANEIAQRAENLRLLIEVLLNDLDAIITQLLEGED